MTKPRICQLFVYLLQVISVLLIIFPGIFGKKKFWNFYSWKMAPLISTDWLTSMVHETGIEYMLNPRMVSVILNSYQVYFYVKH
jgi:uncharacterized membrane protein (DUF441 family)